MIKANSSINSSIKWILNLQLSVIVLSLAGVFSKLASNYSVITWEFLIFFTIVVFLLGIYALLWQQIIKRYELTVAYVNKSLVIIWTFIWAWAFFGETITWNNIFGAILIIIGIVWVFRK